MTRDTAIATRDPELLRETALANGVCIRPVLQELTDTTTGATRVVALPCGSTRQRVCAACADKARRLRVQQCREGWHLEHEPDPGDPEPGDDTADDQADDDRAEDDQADEECAGDEEGSGRRVRSTRRRQDAPNLPRVPASDRTVGKPITSPTGRTYRPSMFLTLTLPSYGRVLADGTPVDPAGYDYRRAALDAMHFGKLVDRFWQNLRRCAGYRVQYFATVEPQRRLAPHLHAAVRGVVPRSVVHQVVAATYHQLWWPAHDEPVYTGDTLPVWDHRQGGYVCPHTGVLLPTWDQALDELDADPTARPAHVVRFGSQADYKWLIAGSPRTDKVVGYLTKYLTKSIADTYGDPETATVRQRAHIDRLHTEARWLPCSPQCANWLRYGIQPKDPSDALAPGGCPKAAHELANLGYGGRRVLVSRRWTGKTLTEHKADRATVVREVLHEAGIEVEDTDRCSATRTGPDDAPRFQWTPLHPTRVDLALWRHALLDSIRERQRRRAQYEHAKARARPTHHDSRSATEVRQTGSAGGEAA